MSHEKEKKKKKSPHIVFKIRRSDLNYGSAAEINISPLATHRFCIQLCLRCEILFFIFLGKCFLNCKKTYFTIVSQLRSRLIEIKHTTTIKAEITDFISDTAAL